MATYVPDVNTWEHLRISVQEFDHLVSVGQRGEIVGHIPGLTAHVWVQGEVPLRPLHEVASFGKRQLEATPFIAPREAARMVPMQVRREDGVDLVRSDSNSLQRPK